MTAIPHAAEALTSASGRFERASARLLEAASAGGSDAMTSSLVEMTEAKVQFRAGVAVVRFADEMWDALLDLAKEEPR